MKDDDDVDDGDDDDDNDDDDDGDDEDGSEALCKGGNLLKETNLRKNVAFSRTQIFTRPNFYLWAQFSPIFRNSNSHRLHFQEPKPSSSPHPAVIREVSNRFQNPGSELLLLGGNIHKLGVNSHFVVIINHFLRFWGASEHCIKPTNKS